MTIKPSRQQKNETEWEAILAEWSASPPMPKEYKDHYWRDDIRKWLCEVFHGVEDKTKRIADLEAENERLRANLVTTADALYWLLNLIHGNSKGGPEYSPPSNSEWADAIETGKAANDEARKTLGGAS